MFIYLKLCLLIGIIGFHEIVATSEQPADEQPVDEQAPRLRRTVTYADFKQIDDDGNLIGEDDYAFERSESRFGGDFEGVEGQHLVPDGPITESSIPDDALVRLEPLHKIPDKTAEDTKSPLYKSRQKDYGIFEKIRRSTRALHPLPSYPESIERDNRKEALIKSLNNKSFEKELPVCEQVQDESLLSEAEREVLAQKRKEDEDREKMIMEKFLKLISQEKHSPDEKATNSEEVSGDMY